MPDQKLPERTARIIAHLQTMWQRSQPVSPNDLKRIVEFVSGLPEQYKQIGLEKIAEHAVNTMSLHILNLIAIFQQYAEQEDISAEDMHDTLDHILPDAFHVLSALDNKLHIQSLDDLAAVTNITVNLQILSSSNTAEEAQTWLYELPTMYYQQLSQEKLTVNNYTSAYMSGQQSFSSTSIMDLKPSLVEEASHVKNSPTFTKELNSTVDAKNILEEDKPTLKIILAA